MNRILALSVVLATAASQSLADACPYSSADWTTLPSKRDLPPEALAAFGELADRSEPFQLTDVVPPGQRLPFSRFVVATAHGCDLFLEYEHGGRGYGHETARFQFVDGHWGLLSRNSSGT
jgi:hypothetical protein